MIRLGVVGFGGRASSMVDHSMREVEPDLRVVGIVDPNEAVVRARLMESDREATFYPSFEEMVKKAKPDGLVVGTRCNLHTPYAIAAAKYDIPLFLEKPVSTSMEQAVQLEAAFEKAKCEVVVSFPLRVSPICELAHQYIAEGAVGSPEHISAVNYVPYGTDYFDGHYRDFSVTQGIFVQKATHDFDYMMYLMGSTITRVAATAAYGRIFGGKKPAGLVCSRCEEEYTCLESPRNRARNLSGGRTVDHPCVFGEDIGTPETGMNEDASNALVEFASGAQGVYCQVFYSRRDVAARGATISGYHGTVSFDWYANELRRIRHHQPFSDRVIAADGMGHFGGDKELAYNFIDVIQGKAKSRTLIWTGIQSIYTCLAAKQSAETGEFVKVRQVGGG